MSLSELKEKREDILNILEALKNKLHNYKVEGVKIEKIKNIEIDIKKLEKNLFEINEEIEKVEIIKENPFRAKLRAENQKALVEFKNEI